MSIQGGCFCGNVRYAIDDGDYFTANCHCTMCRRTTAAPYVSWIMVPKDKFRYAHGAPLEFVSSGIAKRYYCADCHTQLACIANHRSDVVDVTIGSLDEPEKFRPAVQVHTDTRLPWVHDEAEVYRASTEG